MLVPKGGIFLPNSTKVCQFLTWAVSPGLLPRGGVVETRPGQIKLKPQNEVKATKYGQVF